MIKEFITGTKGLNVQRVKAASHKKALSCWLGEKTDVVLSNAAVWDFYTECEIERLYWLCKAGGGKT